MNEDIAKFLASSPIFSELPSSQLEEIAALFHQETYSAGTVVLRQGGASEAVYFIRSGQLAVRIQRSTWRETIAYLQPPDIFGELSFVTGRPCVADVEVLVDAELLLLHRDMIPKLPEHREVILRSLMKVIAGRLQETVARGGKLRETPVVLLLPSAGWDAPRSFAWELGRSLARQTGYQTLLVNLGGAGDSPPQQIEAGFALAEFVGRPTAEALRSDLAHHLTDWKSKFENVLLNPLERTSAQFAESTGKFANWLGFLLGPGEAAPAEVGSRRFIVQSAAGPRLPALSGNRQLLSETRESESAHLAGRTVTARFRRTVDSIARCIAGSQVGLALGGGAAWGWAHIGVLEEFEREGIPIDVVTGCSMGSVIGAFYAAGRTVEDIKEVASRYSQKAKKFRTLKVWKKSLVNAKKVRKALGEELGEEELQSAYIPFWANAVDIRTGGEYTIRTGALVDCILASVALPGLLPPVERDAHLLIDAGMLDPVPVKLARDMGCHFAIGVNAMARLQKSDTRPSFPEILLRSMFLMGHEIGQAQASREGAFVFTPDFGDITMLQFSRSPEIIECGRRATQAQMPAIKAAYERLKANVADQKPTADPFKVAQQV